MDRLISAFEIELHNPSEDYAILMQIERDFG